MKPTFHELELPPQTQCIEFISDLHLDAQNRPVFEAWQRYMKNTHADAVFILGDLFESWVGDDILSAPSALGDFERECAAVLAQTAQNCTVYFMAGNRDFFAGLQMPQALHITLLPDPTLLLWNAQKTILTHGDLLCTDDVKYQEFRQMVHNPLWQQQVLRMPLEARIATAQQMRQQSEMAKKTNAAQIMDVNAQEVAIWMNAAQATDMIHGHTHRPADHFLANGQKRIVLTDWDLNAQPMPKAEVLRWEKGQAFERISLAE